MMFQLSSDLHRRQFMASASALALTMVSQSTLLALGNDVQTMTLGFSTYGSRGITTEEVIPLLAKTGYDAVEITSTKGFDAAPENVAASRRKLIRQTLDDSGLKLTSIMEHTSPDSNQTVNDANLERIQRAVGLIRDITDAKDVVIQTVLGGGVSSRNAISLSSRLDDGLKRQLIPMSPYVSNLIEEVGWIIRKRHCGL